MSSLRSKKVKAWAFVTMWNEEWGFVQQEDRALCTLCLDRVVCQTSSVKRRFETKHEKAFKDEADEAESIKRIKILLRYGKQTGALKVFAAAKYHGTALTLIISLLLQHKMSNK